LANVADLTRVAASGVKPKDFVQTALSTEYTTDFHAQNQHPKREAFTRVSS
jgi:hypothetical protein